MSKRVEMIEETVRQGLGKLSAEGALIVDTGNRTGRSTEERFIVRRPETENTIHWSKANKPISQEFAEEVWTRLNDRIQSRPFHAFRGFVGGYPLVLRSLSPWHVAFAENMFRGEQAQSHLGVKAQGDKKIQILHDPFGKVSDLGLQFPSDVLIILDPVELRIIIIGTAYAGEIKKAAFSLCNYRLPYDGILPMHASANCLEDGSETTILFGLSGTGKTSLSAAPDRFLIGDDEIIWGPGGISNLEGGCYAKLIHLSEEKEPEIYRACNRFGAILENVAFDPALRRVDFSSAARTENTRGSYSLEGYGRTYAQNVGAEAPKNIVFLVADAFGAMPAVARLNSWQGQYHFLAGYTAKVAGTEMGIKEPKAAFSTCFGEPFMPLHPTVYSQMLARFSERFQTRIWLLNTGWTQGGYGRSDRFPIQVTRRILSAIQSGELADSRMMRHPVFGFEVPLDCPGIDSKWLEVPTGSEVQGLARKFIENMRRFDGAIDHRIHEGGPDSSHRELRSSGDQDMPAAV